MDDRIVPEIVADPKVCRYTKNVTDLRGKRVALARMIEKLQAVE